MVGLINHWSQYSSSHNSNYVGPYRVIMANAPLDGSLRSMHPPPSCLQPSQHPQLSFQWPRGHCKVRTGPFYMFVSIYLSAIPGFPLPSATVIPS